MQLMIAAKRSSRVEFIALYSLLIRLWRAGLIEELPALVAQVCAAKTILAADAILAEH